MPDVPSEAFIANLAMASLPRLQNTFEVALVLGGTVSAGAYTAGVLDFLIEALDCWIDARDSQDPAQRARAPRHKVALRVVTGTSGGGVNAAILARALAFRFPPVTPGTPRPEQGTGNPFYDTWVNQIGLAAMLDTSDLATGRLVSALNGDPIDKAARFAAHFGDGSEFGGQLAPIWRAWVGRLKDPADDLLDPLHVMMTMTNLRGVPYLTQLDATLTEAFVDHADHARFAVCYPGGNWDKPRPDERALGFPPMRITGQTDWDTFSIFARATSAFPVGLPPRALARPLSDYRYRVAVVPGDDGTATVKPRLPDWAQLMADGGTPEETTYNLLSVDGGATNNEPIELARTALAGALGRNPRDPVRAWRAVLLVDPFAGKAALGPDKDSPLTTVVGALVNSLIQQTRYDSSDLMLAANDDVFSRFMITPMRGTLTGGDAIASAGLGAFIGFACPEFMRHDFLLGRRNCQNYLRTQLVLSENAEVFRGMWDGVDLAPHVQTSNGQRFLPLIPLVGDAAVDIGPYPWPRHRLNPEDYRKAIETRFKRIAEVEGGGGLLSGAAGWLAGHLAEGAVADFVIGLMKKALTGAKDPLA